MRCCVTTAVFSLGPLRRGFRLPVPFAIIHLVNNDDVHEDKLEATILVIQPR